MGNHDGELVTVDKVITTHILREDPRRNCLPHRGVRPGGRSRLPRSAWRYRLAGERTEPVEHDGELKSGHAVGAGDMLRPDPLVDRSRRRGPEPVTRPIFPLPARSVGGGGQQTKSIEQRRGFIPLEQIGTRLASSI